MIKRSNRLKSFLFLFCILFPVLILCTIPAHSQTATVSGVIRDNYGKALEKVSVAEVGKPGGTTTDENGRYSLTVPANKSVTVGFTFIGFKDQQVTVKLDPGANYENNVFMKSDTKILTTVTITDPLERNQQMIRLDPRQLELIPNVSQSFESVIKTLGMGVVSNNELTSEYSVRGGNFDENLVYVNDVEIFRPLLVRSGQQEGLSFINPDLVSGVKFSSGGFESIYGDKMSSALDIRYKTPTKFAGNANASLQGGGLHLEGINKKKNLDYLFGARYKSNSYLLSTLDTKGNYKPSFTDLQTLVNYDFSKKTSLSFLGNLSLNEYNVIPENRETEFGTVKEALKLTIYFDGQEVDEYNTMQGAFTLTHRSSDSLNLKLIVSAYHADEDETFDILGQYFLDELEKDLSSDNFGGVKQNLGIGSYLSHARNFLTSDIYNAEHKGSWLLHNNRIQWGVKYQHEEIDDHLHEWNYIDSAGYSLPHPVDFPGDSLDTRPDLYVHDVIVTKNKISANRYSGYVQSNFILNDTSRSTFTIGVRATYWDLNKELNISPRIAYAYKPRWKNNFVFRAAAGYYYQPPFYRELRDLNGQVHTDVKAQQSIHFVLGTDYTFLAWGREFKFVTEAYYKHLDHLIPYKMDNLRIRYYGRNNSKGYATGIDFRINGEFVPGVESWASLSLLKTEEDLSDDQYYTYYNSDGEVIYPFTQNNVPKDSVLTLPGYLPRPTDQRVTFTIFFQDYLPKFPSYKMNLTLVAGTGLPTGPPGYERYKDKYRFPFYRRVDIGLSKVFIDEDKKYNFRNKLFRHIKSLTLSAEVFNLLQVNNTVSYLWVADTYGTYYGVPNYLTSRQVNVRLSMKF